MLDDGYEKQDMVKWRDAEVVENVAASADDSELFGFWLVIGCLFLCMERKGRGGGQLPCFFHFFGGGGFLATVHVFVVTLCSVMVRVFGLPIGAGMGGGQHCIFVQCACPTPALFPGAFGCRRKFTLA